MHRYYFIPFIVVVIILLSLIPIGIKLDNIVLAKAAGITTLLITIVALRYWFFILRKNNNKRNVVRLTTNDRFIIVENFPFLKKWNTEEVGIVHGRMGIVLSEVRLLLDNKDLERENALVYAFIIAMKYASVDFLPVAGREISCDFLDQFISSHLKSSAITFDECVKHCESVNF